MKLKNASAVELGLKGGLATLKKHPNHLKEISKLGVIAKQKRKNEAKNKLDIT